MFIEQKSDQLNGSYFVALALTHSKNVLAGNKEWCRKVTGLLSGLPHVTHTSLTEPNSKSLCTLFEMSQPSI